VLLTGDTPGAPSFYDLEYSTLVAAEGREVGPNRGGSAAARVGGAVRVGGSTQYVMIQQPV